MTFDVASDLSSLSENLRLLGEEIRAKMHSVRDEDPECDQKKFNFRELQHQALAICGKYDETYGTFIQHQEVDTYVSHAKLIRDGIEKVRSKLKIQAS